MNNVFVVCLHIAAYGVIFFSLLNLVSYIIGRYNVDKTSFYLCIIVAILLSTGMVKFIF